MMFLSTMLRAVRLRDACAGCARQPPAAAQVRALQRGARRQERVRALPGARDSLQQVGRGGRQSHLPARTDIPGGAAAGSCIADTQNARATHIAQLLLAMLSSLNACLCALAWRRLCAQHGKRQDKVAPQRLARSAGVNELMRRGACWAAGVEGDSLACAGWQRGPGEAGAGCAADAADAAAHADVPDALARRHCAPDRPGVTAAGGAAHPQVRRLPSATFPAEFLGDAWPRARIDAAAQVPDADDAACEEAVTLCQYPFAGMRSSDL